LLRPSSSFSSLGQRNFLFIPIKSRSSAIVFAHFHYLITSSFIFPKAFLRTSPPGSGRFDFFPRPATTTCVPKWENDSSSSAASSSESCLPTESGVNPKIPSALFYLFPPPQVLFFFLEILAIFFDFCLVDLDQSGNSCQPFGARGCHASCFRHFSWNSVWKPTRVPAPFSYNNPLDSDCRSAFLTDSHFKLRKSLEVLPQADIPFQYFFPQSLLEVLSRVEAASVSSPRLFFAYV